MSGSYKIGRLAGIDVFIHWTFLLLLGFLGIMQFRETGSVAALVEELLFVCVVFGVVVLHELGHALAARRYGIHTHDITLLPIGGVARLERIPEDPTQELVVALAGPAVNVVLAAVFGGVLLGLGAIGVTTGSFLANLVAVNVALVLFNLLPAFPMDGGRVLRALLGYRLGFVRATRIAAVVGRGMAVVFALAGLSLGAPMLVVIALFVWIGAGQEARMAVNRAAAGELPVHQVMATRLAVLAPQDPLAVAVDALLAGHPGDFPVLSNGRLVGLLPRTDLADALSQYGSRVPVREVMRCEFPVADPLEPVADALVRMRSAGLTALPVIHAGGLVGLLVHDRADEDLVPRRALRAGEGPRLDLGVSS
jgi:Zn-dependent protease/predicted transcriptional regulator